MNKLLKKIIALAGVMLLTLALAAPAFAADAPDANQPAAQTQEDNTIGLKAIAAGIAVGIAAAGGAEGKVRTTLMLGLVFIETAIIYALLVVILIIFVL